MSDHPNIFPAIRYRDAPAAIEWLAKAFGFEKHFVAPADNGRVDHAELQIGAGMVMLNSKGDPQATTNPWDQVDQGIYVCISDVDAHYTRAKAAGAEIVRELQDTDYGAREYSVRDLEGHLWSFGTYDPYTGS
ncbi:MAG: VOC family protein [Geminicoccaceae bacterium]